MPTERMEEVEVVVCGSCASLDVHPNGLCAKCGYCLGNGDRETAKVPSGSLTAARLRLADAAEAWLDGIENDELDDVGNMVRYGDMADAKAALRTARGA